MIDGSTRAAGGRRARRGLRIEEREEERDDAYSASHGGNSCGGRRMYLSFSELVY